MAFPVSATPWPAGSAQATPPYSGTFIPEIWSGKLIENLYATTVLSGIANTDYEGEIRNAGDKVIIRQYPTVTVRDYVADSELILERPGADRLELLVDKGKYFATVVDDVLRHQMDVNLLNAFTRDAAKRIQIEIDKDVLANMITGVHAANMGPTAGAISGNINLGNPSASPAVPLEVTNAPSGANDVDPVELILRLGQVLDEQNVPEEGRYIVIPSWYARLLKMSDLKDASLTGDSTSPLRNGRLGMIDRFEVYRSNLLPMDTSVSPAATYVYAGHKMGLSFATQFTKVETVRSDRMFGDVVRGLNVYGYTVTKPEALAAAYCRAK